MAHRRGNIHGIIPAALGIAGLACGIAVFICLEQSTLGIAVEYIFLVEIGGTTENKFPPIVVAGLGEGQLVILRAALGGDGDVEIGRAAAGELIRRGGSHAVFKVRQDLAVAALELGGGPCGQVGERHGEAAVVILLEMGIVCQLAGEGGGFLVKGQGHFGTGGAVLMDGGEGYIVAGEEGARRLEGDGVGLRGGIAVIAHLQGDDGAHLNGNGILAAILRAAHIDADAILLVAGGRGDSEGGDALGQNHGIVMHVAGECRDQLACAEGDGLEALVAGVEGAADVRAQIAGMLYGDLVAGFQLAVGHGVVGEALAGKPVVEGTHPAGILRRVLLLDAVDFADVARVRAGLGIAPGRQRVHDAAHHGGVSLEGDPLVHQRPLPGCAVGLGPCGVFHRHMDLACVVVCRQHAHGKQ
ncbi:unknown [Oscillibacter sp. CAG:241]|nr:unknown [Oscillibacter sp. CAG:241]